MLKTKICKVCGNVDYADYPNPDCVKCNWGKYHDADDTVDASKMETPEWRGYRWICPICENRNAGDCPSGDVCPNCGWEDEGYAEEYPDERSASPNGVSLNEAKANYKTHGVCRPKE